MIVDQLLLRTYIKTKTNSVKVTIFINLMITSKSYVLVRLYYLILKEGINDYIKLFLFRNESLMSDLLFFCS